MSDPVEYLTVSEVAAILRMPERSVLRLLKEGRLPGAYGGTRAGWRIRRSDVETWTTNQPGGLWGDASGPAPTRRKKPTDQAASEPKGE